MRPALLVALGAWVALTAVVMALLYAHGERERVAGDPDPERPEEVCAYCGRYIKDGPETAVDAPTSPESNAHERCANEVRRRLKP